MIESAAFGWGLMAGVVLGALVAGFWLSARLRTQFHAQLFSAAERAQRAETLAEELRRQGEGDRADLERMRRELSEQARARAIAETQAIETSKHADEQKAILAQARHELAEAFQALSGEALKQNNEAFLNLAKTSFQTLQAEAKGELAQRQQAIDELVKPLSESLHRYDEQIRLLEQSRQAAYGGLDQHLKSLAESQQRLQQETGNLVNALRAPAVRGRWGEITLKRVAELAGMVAHCDFYEQESVTVDEGRLRPDMVVQLPGGRQIIVDAKTVLAGYLEAHEATNEAERTNGLRRHAAQVRSRMDELSLKAYWSQFGQAPEFVVLFLPGEQFLGAALEQDPRLIEDGFAQGVVLATPTTLMALLRAVAYGWRQERLTEHAEEAGRLGKELYERMAVLAEHLNDVGQSLGKSVVAYNKAVGSLETRILPAARRFKELGVSSDKDIPSLGPVEVVSRKALPHDHE
ncbi:MAG TPA: DNA recombination protein RmuC [Nitrospiraceae bacterium]|nr:DNA recombination protein RmuC [Nitrospiraceae bacterium]